MREKGCQLFGGPSLLSPSAIGQKTVMSGFLNRFQRGTSPAAEKHVHPATPRASTTNPNGLGHIHTGAAAAAGDIEAGEECEGWVDPYGGPPTVKQWFKWYWHDVLAFIFLCVVSLWLLMWSPVPYRKLFAVTANTGNTVDGSSEIINPSFAYPKRKQIIPIIADAMVAVFVPIISIILINILGIATYGPHGKRLHMAGKRGGVLLGRGSFWNVNNGCMGVIYSVLTGAALQIVIKLVIGGLRPHFLTVCDPQIDGVQGMGYGGLYFDTSVCRDHTDPKRRDEIANAMQSFPSGHSIAAWAGLLYLSLYFNAHLKIFSNYHPSYWKLLLFVTPMLAATLIVGSLSLDMSHNWYDVVVGSVMGVAMAILSYRMCFAAVWDFRFNHIPLTRDPRIPGFGYSIEELENWSGGCATRRGGWGIARRYAAFDRGWGAPGDCAFQSAGVGTGLEGVTSVGRQRRHCHDNEYPSGTYSEGSAVRGPAVLNGARGPPV